MDDLRIHDDVASLVADAAAWLLDRIASAQAEGRTPHVALTGGSVAEPFHAEVARRSLDHAADLGRVHWWWGDERFVPSDSDDRNDASAIRLLLAPNEVPADHVHRVATTDDVTDVATAAALYAEELRRHGATEMDVVVLGVGPDGHVASLFPGQAQVEADDAEALPVTDSPKPPPERVTLSMPVLRGARAVLFLATGKSKAPALADARTPGPLPDVPARGPRGTVETVWCLDRAAASALGQRRPDVP